MSLLLEILAWWFGILAVGLAFIAIFCPGDADVMPRSKWRDERRDLP